MYCIYSYEEDIDVTIASVQDAKQIILSQLAVIKPIDAKNFQDSIVGPRSGTYIYVYMYTSIIFICIDLTYLRVCSCVWDSFDIGNIKNRRKFSIIAVGGHTGSNSFRT